MSLLVGIALGLAVLVGGRARPPRDRAARAVGRTGNGVWPGSLTGAGPATGVGGVGGVRRVMAFVAAALGQRSAGRGGDLVELYAQLAAAVEGGLDAGVALVRIAGNAGDPRLAAALDGAGRALGVGVSPRQALADDPRLGPLAAVLDLVDTRGAPAGPTLQRLARAAADEEEARLAVETALSAPRATGRVLTSLPLLGIGLGYAVGADPLRTLVLTPAGRVALVLGLVCAVLGQLWTARLVRSASRA